MGKIISKWTSDCHHKFTNAQILTIAKLDSWQVFSINLSTRCRSSVGSHNLGIQLIAIRKFLL
ncbi:MAG: hypothetical protein U5K69_01490 [Balneolaceae bacterium]|nr:hypothetical protein [Balneolaceae bacterium]